MRYRTDPRRAKAVEMRDGTRYPISREGWFTVTDPRHEREMARYGQPDAPATKNREGWPDVGYVGAGLGHIDAPGHECRCGFAAWSWQTACPRCGSPLTTEVR